MSPPIRSCSLETLVASKFASYLSLSAAGPILLARSFSVVYEGLSTFTPVTVAVKHLWKRRSGSDGSLSESTFLLIKCFLNPCRPEALLTVIWLGPSLESPAEKHTESCGRLRTLSALPESLNHWKSCKMCAHSQPDKAADWKLQQ